MPLKNPKELPKIPKTRKKKAQAALEAIPEKKDDKLEYNCSSFFYFDETTNSQKFIFRIETIAEFTSFAYEVAIDQIIEGREFYFVLMGLKARPNMVPKVQPAITDLPFDGLVGEYTIHIVKQDGAINSATYKINLFTKQIEILEEFQPKKKNNRMFCSFSVYEELFSFSK
jgi:hypothetical protein